MDDAMDESYRFTRTPNGWRFTSPMLWPIGGWVYLVNDAQRCELLCRLKLLNLRINRLELLLWVPMFFSSMTRIDRLSEWLSHAIGIVALAMFVLSLGTPALQLLAIRNILVRAVATSTQVGLWERSWEASKPLSRSSYRGLTLPLLFCLVVCGALCYIALWAYEADTNWFFLIPLAIAVSLILWAVIPAMALIIKLGVGHSEDER
jgi:hypothetical protein